MEEIHDEALDYDGLAYLCSNLLGPAVRLEEGPPAAYRWEFTPRAITAPGWAELAELGKLNEMARDLVAFCRAVVALNEAWGGSLRQPPAAHRRRRYTAQARRRRNEALRQMAAYQRRQARGQA